MASHRLERVTLPPVADRSFADPDIQQYLASRDVVVLAMLTPSGAPLAMPMWFVHDESELIMGTVDGSAKVRHLERDPRVSVVAEGGSRAALDGVVLAGEIRFLTGDERLEWGRRFHAKYTPVVNRMWGGPDIPDNRRVFALAPRWCLPSGCDRRRQAVSVNIDCPVRGRAFRRVDLERAVKPVRNLSGMAVRT